MPSNKEILESLDSLSADSSTSEYDSPLDIMDLNPNLFSGDSEFYPSVTDASETDEAQLRVKDLNLIAYGKPKDFLRRIPTEVSSWSRCQVYLDKSPAREFFYLAKMSAIPDDIALKVPYFHFRIPDPNSPGWVPISKGMGKHRAKGKSKTAVKKSKKVVKGRTRHKVKTPLVSSSDGEEWEDFKHDDLDSSFDDQASEESLVGRSDKKAFMAPGSP